VRPSLAAWARAERLGVHDAAEVHALELRRLEALGDVAEHLLLDALMGVANVQLHEEAVELSLGEGIGALGLDGVLRRDDEERLGERPRGPVRRDREVLHRLEQRGLGLGGRAVDLVGEEQLGEHRPLVEDEAVLLLVEDVAAGDVARHEVRRELDAPILTPEDVRERPYQQRLAEPGDPLDEDVAPGEDRDQRMRDDLLLAEEDPRSLLAQPVELVAKLHRHLSGVVAHRELFPLFGLLLICR
jgi:hypothetical protein